MKTLGRITEREALAASESWGANCGPAALAAVIGESLEFVRPHMGDFERKGYTNPTMMYRALQSLGVEWRRADGRGWLPRGLVRIQWTGPWTRPGVPARVAYRHTHWVACARRANRVGIFDVNCCNNGTGWVTLDDWEGIIAPYLIAQHPRAEGWEPREAIAIVRF